MILTILHAAIAIVLIGCIVIQQRSSGLSSAISGQMGSTTVVKRRGAELLVYRVTIWLSIAFFVIAVVRWYI